MKASVRILKSLSELLLHPREIHVRYSEPASYGGKSSLGLHLDLQQRTITYGANAVTMVGNGIKITGQILPIEYLDILQTLQNAVQINACLQLIRKTCNPGETKNINLDIRYGKQHDMPYFTIYIDDKPYMDCSDQTNAIYIYGSPNLNDTVIKHTLSVLQESLLQDEAKLTKFQTEENTCLQLIREICESNEDITIKLPNNFEIKYGKNYTIPYFSIYKDGKPYLECGNQHNIDLPDSEDKLIELFLLPLKRHLLEYQAKLTRFQTEENTCLQLIRETCQPGENITVKLPNNFEIKYGKNDAIPYLSIYNSKGKLLEQIDQRLMLLPDSEHNLIELVLLPLKMALFEHKADRDADSDYHFVAKVEPKNVIRYYGRSF